MGNQQDKYRSKFSALFLCIYLIFLVVEILHHHHYDLDNPVSFSNSTQASHVYVDLTDDFRPCLLMSFSGTILNYQYSSIGIIKPLTRCCVVLSVVKKDFRSNPHLNNLKLRAPPAIS